MIALASISAHCVPHMFVYTTVKPVLSSHSKRRPKIGFQDHLSLNAGQKYCRLLQGTFIKLPFIFKTFVLPIFEWRLQKGFNVYELLIEK